MNLVSMHHLVIVLLSLALSIGAIPVANVASTGHLRRGSVALLKSLRQPDDEVEAAVAESETEAAPADSSDPAVQEAEKLATEVQGSSSSAGDEADSSHAETIPSDTVTSGNEETAESASTEAETGRSKDLANADVIEETERLAAQAEKEAAKDSAVDDNDATSDTSPSSTKVADAELESASVTEAPPKHAHHHRHKGKPEAATAAPAATTAPPAVAVNIRGKVPSANLAVEHAAKAAEAPVDQQSATSVFQHLGKAPHLISNAKAKAAIADAMEARAIAAVAKRGDAEGKKSSDRVDAERKQSSDKSPMSKAGGAASSSFPTRPDAPPQGGNGKADSKQPQVPAGVSAVKQEKSASGVPDEEAVDMTMAAVDDANELAEEEKAAHQKEGEAADKEMLEEERRDEQKLAEEEREQDRKLRQQKEDLRQRQEQYEHEDAGMVKERLARAQAEREKPQAPVFKNAGDLGDAREERERHEVDRLEAQIVDETKSAGLAEMLGLLKMDSYQLNDKVDMLQKEIEDGVQMEPENPNESLIYPLSTCMRCCIMVAVQYFLVYTAMAVCKAFTSIFELGEATKAEQSLKAACDTVYYAPMLCVLFLGAQLRALQITAGKGGPQDWAEIAMQASAWSLLVQTLLVLAIPVFTGGVAKVSDEESRLVWPSFENAAIAGLLTLLRYASLLGLYVGSAMVCTAVLLMDARSLGAKPLDLWDNPTTAVTEYSPPVSAAMTCTIILTVFFFLIHLLHAVLWSCVELSGGQQASQTSGGLRAWVIHWEQCLRLCISAVDLAPILCALFIAVRMRSLQLDPKYGQPQLWAEASFYAIVACMMAQPMLIVLTKLTSGSAASNRDAAAEGQEALPETAQNLSDVVRSPLFHRALQVVNYLCMAGMYMACCVVLASAFLMQARPGMQTPPVSPTMFCVILLAVLHLGTYLCLFVAQVASATNSSLASLTPSRSQMLSRALQTCKMAEQAVKLGPMIAVLCVGTRMRALQLSHQQGSPQCWAQDAMYIAVSAVVAELSLVLFLGMVSSEAGASEYGKGQVSKSLRHAPQRIVVQLLQAVIFVVLIGSVGTVVASTLIVRPETATCPQRGFP